MNEPLTKEWLASVGFQPDRMGWMAFGSLHIALHLEPPIACVRSLPIPVPATRDEVHTLCRLLGFPINDPTAANT